MSATAFQNHIPNYVDPFESTFGSCLLYFTFLFSIYKESTKARALLSHEKKNPTEDQEVLNFYGERDNVGIIDSQALESS